MYTLVVRGTAFLWHQIRCMAAVLLMVGQGLEGPGLVAKLLDVGATPRKPQYSMAAEVGAGAGAAGLGFRTRVWGD